MNKSPLAPLTVLACALGFGAAHLRAAEPGVQTFDPQLTTQVDTLRQDLRAQGRRFQVGVNPAMEYSLDQLCGTRLDLRPDDYQAHAEGGYLNNDTPALRVDAMPPAFLGWFTPVKNQGQCGSCWAFATVGTLESAVMKKHNAPQGQVGARGEILTSGQFNPLSEQMVLSCNPNGYGCQGGYYSWNMFMPANAARGNGYYQGAIPQNDFPYVAQRIACSFNTNTYYTPVSGWGYVGNGNSVAPVDAIKDAIYRHGAVAACVYADRAFQAYTGGVFTATDNYRQPNHAIMLVGWDDAKGAWLLKNSWGAGWGINGFMWIQYGANSVGFAPAWVEN